MHGSPRAQLSGFFTDCLDCPNLDRLSRSQIPLWPYRPCFLIVQSNFDSAQLALHPGNVDFPIHHHQTLQLSHVPVLLAYFLAPVMFSCRLSPVGPCFALFSSRTSPQRLILLYLSSVRDLHASSSPLMHRLGQSSPEEQHLAPIRKTTPIPPPPLFFTSEASRALCSESFFSNRVPRRSHPTRKSIPPPSPPLPKSSRLLLRAIPRP